MGLLHIVIVKQNSHSRIVDPTTKHVSIHVLMIQFNYQYEVKLQNEDPTDFNFFSVE